MSRIRGAIIAPTAVLLPLLLGLLLQPERAAAQAPAAKAPASPSTPAAAPAPAPTQYLRVMVVDIQTLLQKSKAAQMVRQQIEQKGAEYRKDIAHQEQVLHAEQDQLQREQSKLSPAALNKKGREFQAKVTALNRNVEAKRAALEKSNADAFTKIQTAMLKIIADIAKQRQANLVFQRSDLVLFDKRFDVTDEVLQRLDKELPAVTVNFVTPTLPPATAAAAAPHAAAVKPRK
jgi:Skp family chaperone for outer membrane proteins